LVDLLLRLLRLLAHFVSLLQPATAEAQIGKHSVVSRTDLQGTPEYPRAVRLREPVVWTRSIRREHPEGSRSVRQCRGIPPLFELVVEAPPPLLFRRRQRHFLGAEVAASAIAGLPFVPFRPHCAQNPRSQQQHGVRQTRCEPLIENCHDCYLGRKKSPIPSPWL
jgi:hypothetical protein